MDPAEVMRLMHIIAARGHKTAYLPQTKAEMIAHGISAEEAQETFDEMGAIPAPSEPEPNSAYVCTTLEEGEALRLPDNVVGVCGWGCGRTIQYRAWAPANLVKICIYCAAMRAKDDN